MTQEEALKVLVKMREWRRWGKGEQNEEDRPEMPEQKEVDEALDVYIEVLSKPSHPSNLDEAAEEYYDEMWDELGGVAMVRNNEHDIWYPSSVIETVFKAGAEWNAVQGWIDDGSMPPETKYEEDTVQGHREWTESKPVLAWDSMYGPRVDATKNGTWISEQRGGYTGQICHGIIAWMPIPEYKEKQ